ncbi:MAG: HEPN domain-containing protein [Thermofilum sp.]
MLFKRGNPPKTHNLVELYRLASGLLSGVGEEFLSELTPYYSVSRYPDIFMGVPVVHRSTALRFLEFAKELSG